MSCRIRIASNNAAFSRKGALDEVMFYVVVVVVVVVFEVASYRSRIAMRRHVEPKDGQTGGVWRTTSCSPECPPESGVGAEVDLI